MSLSERFEKYISKEPISGCWLWTGSANEKGYGVIFVGNGAPKRQQKAHRVSWMLKHGEIPDLCVLHRCDVPACVNPDHLFLGTVPENNQDMYRKGRGGRHCHKGASNPRAKITERDVREIRTKALSISKTAQKFGISTNQVKWIRRGKAWANVA